MNISDLFLIVERLSDDIRERLKKQIIEEMGAESSAFEKIPLENLLAAILLSHDDTFKIKDIKMIAYGAGKMAQKYIPVLRDKVQMLEIWDAYSDLQYIAGIRVVKPFGHCKDQKYKEKQWEEGQYKEGQYKEEVKKNVVVIFIDDRNVRKNVTECLNENGYEEIYYFRDFLNFIEGFELKESMDFSNPSLMHLVENIFKEYRLLDSKEPPACIAILKKSLDKVAFVGDMELPEAGSIYTRLNQFLCLDTVSKEVSLDIIRSFISHRSDNVFSFACQLEIFIRKFLSGHVKTRKRPMRMEGEGFYDQFSVYITLREVLSIFFKEEKKILDVWERITEPSRPSVPATGVKCYYLLKHGKCGEALKIIREIVKREPNNLLADEIMYEVVMECKEHGIFPEEAVPKYDLKEYFCWSGLNFAWCGGFAYDTGDAMFSPCFRPLQCAARPEGEFWKSSDWKEFRESVTDGTFRYCQKMQCPNIVAGWLPKKKDCTELWLREILEGDFEVIPPVEEYHFSYDEHCNLMCPSCRTEYKINSKEQSDRLDFLYQKNLYSCMKTAKHLTLSGCGEAIISPHSKSVLKSFSREKNPDLVVELRTNATAIDPVSWSSLGSGREVIRHITVSIDASKKETFEKLRYPAKWDVVTKNLEFISSLRNRKEIDMFEFHVVVQTENIDQLCDIVRMSIKYGADAVTFSRLINWRGMTADEYFEVNPFWPDHPKHQELLMEVERLKELRKNISDGLTECKKQMYINIHFEPDPDSSYDSIRRGRYKIR